TWGELFQNNHHQYGMSPNFAARAFELDPTYQVMRVLAWLKLIDLGAHPQFARYPATSLASRSADDDAPAHDAVAEPSASASNVYSRPSLYSGPRLRLVRFGPPHGKIGPSIL